MEHVVNAEIRRCHTATWVGCHMWLKPIILCGFIL